MTPAPAPQLVSADALTQGSPERFTAEVQLATIAEAPPGPGLSAYEVFFAAGARTVWHEHQGEQILIGLTGTCVVQLAGHPARTLLPGQALRIPARQRHWHGAAADGPASHLGLNESLPTAWLEPVEEEEYARAVAEAAGTPVPTPPRTTRVAGTPVPTPPRTTRVAGTPVRRKPWR